MTPNGADAVLSDDDWQKALKVNLLASVPLDRAFFPGMIEHKSGAVFHVSSMQHRVPRYDPILAYAAAKGALSAYSKGLATEVGRKGVRVNMISPGFMETYGARNDGATCPKQRHHGKRCAAADHEHDGRHSDWTARLPGRGCKTGRVSSIPSGGIHSRSRLRYRRRHDAHGRTTAQLGGWSKGRCTTPPTELDRMLSHPAYRISQSLVIPIFSILV